MGKKLTTAEFISKSKIVRIEVLNNSKGGQNGSRN